ncbi:MAG: hypothetical protein IH944_13610 [Armatimonadetes bacterium]|nr:hypothetical protein [Armatimonadota bacterium]
MASESPRCVALLLCDYVVEDKRTGNKSFIGTFNGISGSQSPMRHDRMFVVISLTNVLEPCQIMVRIVQPEGASLLEMKGEIRADSPLQVLDMVLEFRGIVFPSVGQHSVEVTCESELLAMRQFEVTQRK